MLSASKTVARPLHHPQRVQLASRTTEPTLTCPRSLKRSKSIQIRSYGTFGKVPGGSATPKPRLRFAPSPTGYLHLGGLRTALFNHLFAKRYGGTWVLRIEDTDQKRLVPGSIDSLIETLHWSKLEYDEGPDKAGSYGPYIQSERLEIYARYAERLLKEGKAYRDFRGESNITHSGKRDMVFRENYLPPDEDEARQLIRDGKPFVVRLKAETRPTDHEDLVYGRINFPADPLKYGTEDPILLKSNGWPTYHLANVVDDHEMGITHVLRGEEWLPSLPKHLWLYRALGLTPPKFAHLPLLINPDGTKLSKRTGDVKVEDYRSRGFEPEALNNFVALMGYNHHRSRDQAESGLNSQGKGKTGKKVEMDDGEVMSMEELISGFEISKVTQSRAAVSLPKLFFLNSRHMTRKLEDPTPNGGRDDIVSRVRPLLEEEFPEVAQLPDDRIVKIVQLTKGTSETLKDVPKSSAILFKTPSWSDPEPKSLFERNPKMSNLYLESIRALRRALNEKGSDAVLDDLGELNKMLRNLGEDLVGEGSSKEERKEEDERALLGQGKKGAKKRSNVMVPLRFALTATDKGPTLAELINFLGKEEVLKRLEQAESVYLNGGLS
ncbi:glutamyl-tRNA synthetase [Violaceomyces palustris]|uniref:Glutamyl-tRNA synthetase n=1 Tax=Violaceomyces palustris TaxID=1673888 RepID=A0ACD0NN62_9BASI|nr:glutamyl-tRNA synthetase [Violaceomyces palustris]